MTRIELLNLAREKFKQAGNSVDAYLGIAECCDELALYEPNPTAIKTLAAGARACTQALALNPESIEARTRRAALVLRQAERLSGKYSQKRWQRACGHISRILAVRPDSPPALSVSGNLERFAVDHRYPNSSSTKAIEKYKTAVSYGPDYHSALTDWACSLVAHAREVAAIEAAPLLKEAESRCEEALAIRPESYVALSILGDINYCRADSPGAADRAGLLDLATAHYQRALRLRPDWFPAMTGLAAVLKRKASTKRAADANELLEQALVKCHEALSLREDLPVALITASHILMDFSDDGRLAETQELADRAVKAGPDNPETWRARGRLQFTHANRAPFPERTKLLDLAAADYTAADSRGTHSARTKTNIANLTIARANMADDLDSLPLYLQAAAEASSAIAVRADWAGAFIALGNALVSFAHREPLAENRITRLREAEDKLRRAHEIEATARSYAALGNCLLERSRTLLVHGLTIEVVRDHRVHLVEQAIDYFKAATKAEPSRPGPLTRLADARRRLANFRKESRSTSARSLYEGALKLDPNHSSALRGLGLLLLEAGELQPAIEQLSTAARANPDDAGAAANLATAYCRLATQTRNPEYLDKAAAVVDQERLGKRNYAHRLLLRADIIQRRARLTKYSQAAGEAAVASLREALHYRQAAWPATNLIRAALELFNLTYNRNLLKEIADPVRAAIATEPDNDDAQNALFSFNKFLDGPPVETPSNTELHKAVDEINYDYHW